MSTPQPKVIATCAITGSVRTPSMTPHLLITPTQIATSAVEAAEAGAAILHLQVRELKDDRPSADPTLHIECLEQIKGRTNAVINLTTGGSQDMIHANTRRVFVQEFPFALIYRTEPDGIVIFAAAHSARRPYYWQSRLPAR